MVAAFVIGGPGISGLHYTSMESMRFHGEHGYLPGFVVAAVMVGIVMSYAALRHAVAAPINDRSRLHRSLSAILMGAPIWTMHYTAMAGTVFAKAPVFFMSNWEGYRDRKQSQNNYSVPLTPWRTGDFSSYAGVLYDPATCSVSGSTRTCAAFPGNRIPASRVHPISQKLLEFYPEPTGPGTSNNYTSQQNRVIDKDQFTRRVDFVQSSSSTWMGRYSHSRDDEISPALKLNGTKLVNRIHQAMIGNTRTLSPTVVNELCFGYNSFFNTFGRESAFVRDVTSELGIPGMASIPPEAWGIPSIGINGVQRLWRQHRGAVHQSE